jgi:HSP20 family molecular chaperone IbpA
MNIALHSTMPRKSPSQHFVGRVGDLAFDFQKLPFAPLPSASGWKPAVDLYAFEDRFELWVDLAGVEKQSIEVEAFPNRVRVSGERHPPVVCRGGDDRCRQVLVLEIESGRFGRDITLPQEINRDRVTAEQINGLLRIKLPFAN